MGLHVAKNTIYTTRHVQSKPKFYIYTRLQGCNGYIDGKISLAMYSTVYDLSYTQSSRKGEWVGTWLHTQLIMRNQINDNMFKRTQETCLLGRVIGCC